MKEQEKHIIFLLHRQDKSAIGILYDQYAPALYGVVLRIVRSEAIAQDVVQEAFVKAWQHADRYDPVKGTLFTWLLNIARNRAIDKTRSASFRQNGKTQPIDQALWNNEGLSTYNNPEHIGLRKIVAGLESKYRAVIELAYFQGFTQSEIADHLGLPTGTVKSRVRIGLRELRKIFDEHSLALLWIFAQNILLNPGLLLLV